MQTLNEFIEEQIKPLAIEWGEYTYDEAVSAMLRSFAHTIAREVATKFKEEEMSEKHFAKVVSEEKKWVAGNQAQIHITNILAEKIIQSLETK